MVILSALVGAALLWGVGILVVERGIGLRDFTAYWTAFHHVLEGLDPYDSRPLHAGDGPRQPYMNPPWTLVMMAPVLVWNLQTAAALWFLLGLAAFVCVPLAGGRAAVKRNPWQWLWMVGFGPAYLCLALGNQSLVLASSVVLFFHAWNNRSFFWAALWLLPFASKPQLTLPLCAVLAAFLWRTEGCKVMGGALGAFGLINGFLLLWRPEIYAQWAGMSFDPMSLRTSSWLIVVREWLVRSYEWDPGVLSFLPLVLASGVLFACAWYKRRDSSLEKWAGAAIFAGCLLSPYVWTYDFVLLVVAFVWVTKDLRPLFGLCTLLFLAVTSMLALVLFSNMHHHAWLPWIWLPIWLVCVIAGNATPAAYRR